ncbi:MAG: DUF1667 domain-containing protein [Clostridia bacterium]|nr:DUF1667 domain-containing protein [Clostridia bacterium]
MKYELTCINCPMGCRITADYDGKEVTNIEGYTCRRGLLYAQSEITDPTRMLTALMALEGTHVPLPVKTDRPIRKALLPKALEQIKSTRAKRPVRLGAVVIENVCNSGANVIATAERL